MRKENKYVVAFDANKDFKEIRIMDDSSEPFTVDPDMNGGSIYIFTHKEFKKLIESAMSYLTDPMGEDTSEDIDRVKDPYGGSIREKTLDEAGDAFKSANITHGAGAGQMRFRLSGYDNRVAAGDGGVCYAGDIFDKGNGEGNER